MNTEVIHELRTIVRRHERRQLMLTGIFYFLAAVLGVVTVLQIL